MEEEEEEEEVRKEEEEEVKEEEEEEVKEEQKEEHEEVKEEQKEEEQTEEEEQETEQKEEEQKEEEQETEQKETLDTILSSVPSDLLPERSSCKREQHEEPVEQPKKRHHLLDSAKNAIHSGLSFMERNLSLFMSVFFMFTAWATSNNP